jgi:uncharacterized protein YecT (DUF1311 family)
MRLLIIVLGLIGIVLVAAAGADDCGNAPTQAEINKCVDLAYQKSDAELNALYGQIASRLGHDPDSTETLKALIAAQRAWITFRDAECAFVASRTLGSSANLTIVDSCLSDVTAKRITDLKAYLKCHDGDLSCPVPPR